MEATQIMSCVNEYAVLGYINNIRFKKLNGPKTSNCILATSHLPNFFRFVVVFLRLGRGGSAPAAAEITACDG